MNNYLGDIDAVAGQFDANTDQNKTTEPLSRFGPSSATFTPRLDDTSDSRRGDQALSQKTSTAISGEIQALPYDVPPNSAQFFDDAIFAGGNSWDGTNGNSLQDFQGNDNHIMNGSVDPLAPAAIHGLVWGHNDTISESFPIDLHNSQNFVEDNIQSAFISPGLLSTEQVPEVPVHSDHIYMQDKSSKGTRQPGWGKSRSGYKSALDSTAPKSGSTITPVNSELPQTSSTPTSQHSGENISRTSTEYMKQPDAKDRASHNNIEKKYRNRLNSQFEVLLRVLPSDMTSQNYDTGRNDAIPERKISKTEVLVLATKYIQDLEKEGERLKTDNEQLRARKEELEDAWIRHGGMRIP